MNDKIATAFLTTLAGAMVVGILYIVFVPIPEDLARNSKEAAEAERVRATVACIEHSGASKDRDYKLAGYKAAKCAEQTR
jgi:flagellar motor component MotA